MARMWSRLGLVLSGLSLALLALTLAVPDWVERLLHVSPDGGNGSIEAMISIGLVVVSVVSGAGALLAWRSVRRSVARSGE